MSALGVLLREILNDVGRARVTVIGNSAGDGLAVATAQWLRDHGASGKPARMQRGQIILHVCLHGTYHRGMSARSCN